MFHPHRPQPLQKAGRRFAKRLYFRIWLAVIASLVVVGLLAGAAWRMYVTDMPHGIVLTDAAGNKAGTARV